MRPSLRRQLVEYVCALSVQTIRKDVLDKTRVGLLNGYGCAYAIGRPSDRLRNP